MSLKSIFQGAKETIGNYYDAWQAGQTNGKAFTQEMREYALKFGPVDSFAYRTALTNAYIAKNPSSIVAIGSVGKAGLKNLPMEKGGYILDFSTKTAKTVARAGSGQIRNVAGFAKSVATKANAGKAFSSIFKGTFGKVLGVAGAVTGLGLLATNTLDFYNWQGPIQTALKRKFPWLFPAVKNAKEGKKTNEIKRLTPAETKQLQQLFYEQTGQIYTGEELRKLIYQEFGITVLEIAPTKGNSPGPLSAGDYTGYRQSSQPKTKTLKVNPITNFMIQNQDELESAAMNEISAFIQSLPSKLSFEILLKKSYKDADGKTRKGDFAFVKISATTRTGGKSVLAELPIGTTPPNVVSPGELNAMAVETVLAQELKPNITVPSTTPTPGQSNDVYRNVKLVKAMQKDFGGNNRVFFIDRFGVSHEILNGTLQKWNEIGINLAGLPEQNIDVAGTLPAQSGANYDIALFPAKATQDYADSLLEKSANQLAGVTK